MTNFLIDLADLLENYGAEIWAAIDAQGNNRIGVECEGRSIEIDSNVSECVIDYTRIMKAIK